ncbi:MAG: SEL1-like repeat protein [Proteobacteria bacterium]|nr:SEL1-like repeat protein [Pseudomonadota bacterium]
MSGIPDETRPGPRRPWRLLLGVLVACSAAGALAFVTIHPPPLPVRHAKKAGTAVPADGPSRRPLAFADDLVLPPPEIPPAPTTAEITRKPATASPPPPAPAPPLPSVSPPPAAPPPPSMPADKPAAVDTSAGDPASLSLQALKKQAESNDLPSMIEMARRLIEGDGIAKDPQAGAGWMLRAAELGSIQAAFNIGVMYESGFVVERNSAKAAQWYRRAADAGLPAAQHNLALLLRTGKGVPRDQAEALKLLLAAAHQGMAAAMFTLGDIYERGDAAAKDLAAAVAWYEVAARFDREANGGQETALARSALQRSQTLQRVLTPAELRRAQDIGRSEIAKIIAGVPSAERPAGLPAPALPAPAPESASGAAGSKPQDPAAGWPAAPADQVRAIQQALFDLKFLKDKPDGLPGPMTSSAIREFQRGAGLAETGEPTKDVYIALKQALAKRAPGAALPAGTPPAPAAAKP